MYRSGNGPSPWISRSVIIHGSPILRPQKKIFGYSWHWGSTDFFVAKIHFHVKNDEFEINIIPDTWTTWHWKTQSPNSISEGFWQIRPPGATRVTRDSSCRFRQWCGPHADFGLGKYKPQRCILRFTMRILSNYIEFFRPYPINQKWQRSKTWKCTYLYIYIYVVKEPFSCAHVWDLHHKLWPQIHPMQIWPYAHEWPHKFFTWSEIKRCFDNIQDLLKNQATLSSRMFSAMAKPHRVHR